MPFTATVNVGSDKIGCSWLHQTGPSPLHRDGIDLPTGHTLLSLIGSLTNSGWGGCVRARVAPQGYDLTDQPPDPLASWRNAVRAIFRAQRSGLRQRPAFPESGYTSGLYQRHADTGHSRGSPAERRGLPRQSMLLQMPHCRGVAGHHCQYRARSQSDTTRALNPV